MPKQVKIQYFNCFWSTALSSSPSQSGSPSHIALSTPCSHLRQLALQCAATFTVLSLSWPIFLIRDEALPWPGIALAIGGIALLGASITSQLWWWRLIHALFAPLIWAASTFAIDPGWFLLAFILMLFIYRGALSGQIPLYLSNADSASALAEIASSYPGARIIDLGAGIGSVLRFLSKTRPDAKLTGIENAPFVWLIGYLRTRFLANSNCCWIWGDFWSTNLGEFDVVYAFLSPAPMPSLWKKIELEMCPGSLFISNSFAVPEIEPSRIIEISDARKTRLYCYER